MKRIVFLVIATVIGLGGTVEANAQSRSHHLIGKVDSLLSARYYRKGNIDTAYVQRPQTKWTLRVRLNESGTKIETKGVDQGSHFKSEILADRKLTLSIGVSYLGFSLSAALNPAKMLGKYRDYELNLNSYGKRLGFDFSYQNAHNFTGWRETEGMERIELPDDMLSVETLNLNAYYAFNHRRFSYPAAFSQSYIQRRSTGSFMLAFSGQAQNATFNGDQEMQLKMINIGIGAGYGYNYVPKQGWLLHISALPTLVAYSHTSITFDGNRVPLHYRFPQAIITSRGSVVRQLGKKSDKFIGLLMVYTFANVGNEDYLAVYNSKWRVRAFFGLRL